MARHRYNWAQVGYLFTYQLPQELQEAVDEAIENVQEIYTNSIKELIDSQPGSWTPKSENWARRSGSRNLYIGEKGEFYSFITDKERNVRGLRAKQGDKRLFIGARHDIFHHSGYSMRQLAEILQSIPDGSRVLFTWAYERVEYQIKREFHNVGLKLRE